MRREATADRTAQLLNSQAMNLDVLEVRRVFHVPPVSVTYHSLALGNIDNTARMAPPRALHVRDPLTSTYTARAPRGPDRQGHQRKSKSSGGRADMACHP